MTAGEDRADKRYYHGTWDGYAHAIMTGGFRLGQTAHGQRLGRGLYIAQAPAAAALWAWRTIITCRLAPATRILWIQDGYDQRVIDALRREFGQELLDLGPHFHRAIPGNKQLTGRELRHLCNYIFYRGQAGTWRYILAAPKGKKAQYLSTWQRLSRLHGTVKRHGYDALGDRSFAQWDSDEILVFNPSRVIPVSAHRYRQSEDWARVELLPPLSPDALARRARRAQEEEE